MNDANDNQKRLASGWWIMPAIAGGTAIWVLLIGVAI